MDPITPNPHSPYADADPTTRHLIPSPAFFPDAQPGVLALTGCLRMAVVPTEPLRDVNSLPGDTFPPGFCPAYIDAFHASMAGRDIEDDRPVTDCRECDSKTRYDGLCAVCRQEKHDEWWPTRNQSQPTA